MATYEEIKKANDSIITTDIKGKAYSEVPQRIKAFRMVHPDGFIISEMISNENGVCIFKTSVGYYSVNGEMVILGTGTAYEKEGSTFINKTSYIENCETSAVGRALGMAGFGIDTSVASAEEVQNAIANQEETIKTDERKATPKQIEFLLSVYTGDNLDKLLKANNLTKLEDMPMSKASELISKIKGEKK
jgi:hypothetical protein